MANRTISSGHGKRVAGASYYIDEVAEARKVVNRVGAICELLDPKGTIIYHEDNTTNKEDNLRTIIKYHNSTNRKLDFSVHFNSSKFKDKHGEYTLVCTDSAVGTETLYSSNRSKVWAEKMTTAVARAGQFKDRGAKHRTNLGFLNQTKEAAILLELCFVNSKKDVELYKQNFENICIAIAEVLTGKKYNPLANNPRPGIKKYDHCILYSGEIDKAIATCMGFYYTDCIVKDLKDHVECEGRNLYVVGGACNTIKTDEKFTKIMGNNRKATHEAMLKFVGK